MRYFDLTCKSCEKEIEVAEDFLEFMSQVTYFMEVEVECIRCAGLRQQMARNNMVAQSIHKEPVR